MIVLKGSSSLPDPARGLSPSSAPVPRQLPQMCLSSLPSWQWIMNGMLLLLAAGWCCGLSGLLRGFILAKQKALLLFLAFCSSEPTARRGDESGSDLDRDHRHMTSPAKPAMFELDYESWALEVWRSNWFTALFNNDNWPSWKTHFRAHVIK